MPLVEFVRFVEVSGHGLVKRVLQTGWPAYGYGYGYGYGGCAWLRRQALITGSPYW